MSIFDIFKAKNTDSENGSIYNSYADQIEKHIEKYIGSIDFVLHELVSDKVHIDVEVVKPTARRNYYTLITCGMSTFSMNIPKDIDKTFSRAEVLINLPADWKIDNPDTGLNFSNDEANWWPIRLLKSIALTPIYENTWIGPYHTLSSDEENTPYSNNTKLCSAIVTFPYSVGPEFSTLKINKNTDIQFYEVFPIYKEELLYKQEKGGEALLDLLEKHKISLLLDPNRLNAVMLEESELK